MYQYRKYKEIYKININILKQAIDECDCMVSRFKGPGVDDSTQTGSGMFAMFDRT